MNTLTTFNIIDLSGTEHEITVDQISEILITDGTKQEDYWEAEGFLIVMRDGSEIDLNIFDQSAQDENYIHEWFSTM